jgi:hypothetical protein
VGRREERRGRDGKREGRK